MNGLLDFLQGASNSAAGTVSAPVDGIAWLLRKAGVPVPDAPVGGSNWLARQGLTDEPQNKLLGLLGEAAGMSAPIVAAAKAPQIARGLLQAGDNLAAQGTITGPSASQRGVITAKLSKRGDPVDAAMGLHDTMRANNGQMPYEDIAQMTRSEFDKFYERLAPHHQGKFDRLLRAHMPPMYDDLPTTLQQYAKDFAYENPALVRQLQGIKPDSKVTLYRSVSKADPDTAIMPGDWVALQRNYAAQHGYLGNDAPRMLKTVVPAKDVRWAGTSADEYFYVPSSGVSDNVQSKYDALLHSLGLLGR